MDTVDKVDNFFSDVEIPAQFLPLRLYERDEGYPHFSQKYPHLFSERAEEKMWIGWITILQGAIRQSSPHLRPP